MPTASMSQYPYDDRLFPSKYPSSKHNSSEQPSSKCTTSSFFTFF